jgi:uracil-DNA glycosylase family protein
VSAAARGPGPERPDRPGAQPWVPGRPSLRGLREAVQECRGCELHHDATQGVMGEGPLTAELMIVGEQPGDQEDRQGHPFVGPAGRLLDKALGDAGIDPQRVFLTNAVKHFRFQGTRGKQRIHKSPSRVHVAACGPWLLAELALVRPRGMVLLGATAGQAVHGPSFRVGDSRGRLQDWPKQEPSVRARPDWTLATTHPSAVLRSRNRDEDYERLVADLRVAADALAAGPSGA